MNPPLNLPAYSFKTRQNAQQIEIFDAVRRKYVALTPEEWVRQHIVRFLIEERAVPSGRMQMEKVLRIGALNRRADVVVFDDYARPLLIVECKAPEVQITQAVFEQIACYNMALKVNNLLVTNGLQHYFCIVNHNTQQCRFVEDILTYDAMNTGGAV